MVIHSLGNSFGGIVILEKHSGTVTVEQLLWKSSGGTVMVEQS